VRAVFAAFLCTILFSGSIVCGHRSAKLIGGTEANFWRLVVATVFLGVWAYGFGNGLAGKAFPVFLVSGMVGIGIGDLGLFQALPRLGSRRALLLVQCLTPPCGALLEWLWLGTTLSLQQIVCGIVILLGVGVALTPAEHLQRTRREWVVGTIGCIVGALGGAGGAVLSRKAYALAHDSQEPINGGNAAFQRIIGGLLVSGICLLAVKRRALRLPTDTTDPSGVETAKKKWRSVWPWVLVNGFAGQTLGVSCMQWALETTPTGLVLAIIATTPIVIIPFAFALEGERPNLHSLVGGIIAVAGTIGLCLSR
jgi:drug/metabolite transporter (DMT)-like permease